MAAPAARRGDCLLKVALLLSVSLAVCTAIGRLGTGIGFGAGGAPPLPTFPGIKTVHVVSSCHLDIGFADFAVGIINQYFDHHLPLAASIGDELRRGVPGFTDSKLNFKFTSWVLDVFFDCPPGLGLHCPSREQQDVIKAAIAKDDITWDAFPDNAQLEIMNPALIKAGVEISHALDKKFGKEPKRTLSQRDVPGMTRATIPVLRKKGVTAISIGANGGSTPPDLPACFLWRDPISEESIMGLFTWPGYGDPAHQKTCLVEGLDHALVYNWGGDNAGPPQATDFADTWETIAAMFPRAAVYASTLDNFTQHLEKVKDKLPVIEKEVGDTWIHGVPSDPQKVSVMRVFNRIYAAVDARPGGIEQALAEDDVLRNATRFVLKLGEHTWGKDVKSTLHDNADWKNADFERARDSKDNGTEVAALETSWWEQRHWGATTPYQTLAAAGHPLAKELRAGFDQLLPSVPDLAGFREVGPGDVLKCGGTEVAFDATGSVSHLVHDGFSWADADHAMLQLKYRSYSARDVADFFNTYCTTNDSWVEGDYGKPGLPDDVVGKVWTPRLQKLYAKEGDGACAFVAHVEFEPEAVREYGAATAWTQVTVSQGALQVEVGLFNKTRTRLPETMFLQFLPTISAGRWSVNKLGQWIGVREVISGGAKHMHGVSDAGVRVEALGKRLEISSLDAPVVSFGELSAYPPPLRSDPDTTKFGSSFVLWDNLWGTNYIMWWPYAATPPPEYAGSAELFPARSSASTVARFRLQFDSGRPLELWM